jgi:hypothetical protein
VVSNGTVRLKEIWDMLEHFAPGYEVRSTDHNWRITVGTAVYPTLPLGPHGKREKPEIELRHVCKMARFFGILDCAQRRLPQL